MPPIWFYDLMYRWHTPWEMGARSELVALVGTGCLTPERLAPGRAVDLGCGAGANAVFLAQAGFDVVGIDFSPVALGKARRASLAAGVSERVRLVRADLTAHRLPDVEGPFDLLVDYGTLDDLAPTDRRAMASTIIRLAHPGSIFVLYELRQRMALHYLSGEKVSVNETAYLVGFSDPAAFSRAFKRWTGTSPRAVRTSTP